MGWTICHVNLAATDVREAAEFYNGVFGPQGMHEKKLDVVSGQTGRPSDTQHLAYFEDGTSRSIHIAKPDAEYARERGMWINPTAGGHLAIRVEDIASVKRALDDRKWTYYDAGEFAVNGRYSIYLFDPAWNMLEVNQPIE